MQKYFIHVLLLVTSVLALAPLAFSEESRLPFKIPSMAEVRTMKSAVLRTSRGDIVFKLFPETAPTHVANLKYLADSKFFNGKRVNRVLPSHVVMFGDPLPAEAAQYSYSLPPEFSDQKHLVGTLSMARDTRPHQSSRRHSNATRIHLLLSENARMDGDYTVMGHMLRGEDVLRSLREGDEIQQLIVFIAK